jgi:putative NADH-flavin reductase
MLTHHSGREVGVRLTVFGSTGPTGRALVQQALGQGHEITAVARDPAAIDVTGDRLRAVRADVLDGASLNGVLNGVDATLSAIGTHGRRPTTVYSAGVANIRDAMHHAGVRRFVGISALPVTPRTELGKTERRVVVPMLSLFFGEMYADMTRMEQVLRESDLDFTIMRPPQLTNGRATGQYRTAINDHLPRARKISRADLAAEMLKVLPDTRTLRATVSLAY